MPISVDNPGGHFDGTDANVDSMTSTTPSTTGTSTTSSSAGLPVRSELVTAIDHAGVAVPDLDVAIAWYTEHLGMVSVHEEINEGQGVREAMLSFPGAPAGATALQLLAPLDENSTIAKFIGRNGPGLQQLAYRVTDIDEISVDLRGHGVRLLYDTPRRGTADSRINFIHPKDAGGVLIELVEPASAPH
ncbi:MAG: methylmalonyl-CoA/ethylmalonyl-CoA epimerase [Rhodococcus sp. (in: high G+C Gram-positive bacteria)]|jgi:methylmalonyl-CoA/ethylmalonyl-CoA epimerase